MICSQSLRPTLIHRYNLMLLSPFSLHFRHTDLLAALPTFIFSHISTWLIPLPQTGLHANVTFVVSTSLIAQHCFFSHTYFRYFYSWSWSFGKILESQKSYKGSIKTFCIPFPQLPLLLMSYNHSVFPKICTILLTTLHWCNTVK